jgi:heterodisulfide reductase subunit B
MNYAYFPGCRMAFYMPRYDRSLRAVFSALGIGLRDMDAPCCGFPSRHQSLEAAVLSSVGVLAEAARLNLPMMTPCKCCFGHLKIVQAMLRDDARLRGRVGAMLDKRSDLDAAMAADCRQLLTVLGRDAGPEMIRSRTIHSLEGLAVAAHYGCHALRPSDATGFDDPAAPTLFETVLEAAGAQCVSWAMRLECCGNPLWGKNDRLALALMHRKLDSAVDSGADAMATACTWCQMQFEGIHLNERPPGAVGSYSPKIPTIFCAELLGLAFGLTPEALCLCGDAAAMALFNDHCRGRGLPGDGQPGT